MTDCREDCPIIGGGMCPRHNVRKHAAWVQLCITRPKYFESWESGRGPGQLIPTGERRPATISNGAGTEVTKLFRSWGMSACGGCLASARKMDEMGTAWCREHIDELAEEIHQNATHRKWTAILSRTATAMGIEGPIVRYAIREACDRADAGLDLLVVQALSRFDDPPGEHVPGWESLPAVHEAHRRRLNEVAAEDHPYPGRFTGRGIVTLGGSAKFFTCAYVLIRMLRKLGCTLPVELWYLGPGELDNTMQTVVESLGDVTCVDAVERFGGLPRMLGGWECKVWSIMHSRFEEVLFLDADQVPACDPSYLFDDQRYRDVGAVFWPDLRNEWGCDIHERAFVTAGLPIPGRTHLPEHGKPSDYRPFESGQMLVNKSALGQWHALEVCRHVNDHSDYWYRQPGGRHTWWIYGDKSTFFLAWEKTKTPYAMPRDCDWTGNSKGGAFLQHDLDGQIVFQHRCQPTSKLSLHGRNIEPPNFVHHDMLAESLADLRSKWVGHVWAWEDQGPMDNQLAVEQCRDWGVFGIDWLPPRIRLRGKGIVDGAPGCCWTLRHLEGGPFIVLSWKEKGEFATLGRDDHGNWCRHPDQFLVPAPPPEFEIDHDRLSLTIWHSVTACNEYRLPDRLSGTVIDLGAHVGAFTLEALRRGADLVVAVEPAPENFRRLYHNTQAVRDRVWCVNAAIASASRVGWLGGGGDSFGWQLTDTINRHFLVPVVGIGDLLEQLAGDVSLVKIDVEGAEWDVLRNTSWLARVRTIVGEWHAGPGPEVIGQMLRATEFSTAISYHATETQIGHFWGWRGDCPFAIRVTDGVAVPA